MLLRRILEASLRSRGYEQGCDGFRIKREGNLESETPSRMTKNMKHTERERSWIGEEGWDLVQAMMSVNYVCNEYK